MKILIDIGHPAHVHYFRNFIKIMESKGHEFLIVARERGIIKELLDKFQIKFINRGKGSDSRLGKFYYMFKADLKIYQLAKKFNPNIFLSFSSPYAAQVSYFMGKPHIAINDTEHTDSIHLKFTYPFSKTILTPSCYLNDLGKKQIKFNGVVEWFYLHDKYFKYNSNIRKQLGLLENEEFVLIRLVSWKAHHDFGQSGIDNKTILKIIKLLENRYKVFISSEDVINPQFKKYMINIPSENMHSLLKEATLFIGESATMASESALLGTQVIYINSLPLMGYLKLEQDYGLLKHFKQSDGIIKYLNKIIIEKNFKNKSNMKSKILKSSFTNITEYLIWFVENYPESIKP